MMEHGSANLLLRWRGGDQDAADELFARYAQRLLALARSRFSATLARHLDPEDVLQSVYRSFFVGARDGRYVLQRSGDLWRLLVAITIHKLRRQVERSTAAKRSEGLARHGSDAVDFADLANWAPAREPTPMEAAALADTLERALRGLSPLERRMVELRLQGHRLEEVASEVSRSERTVRRVLEQVKVELQRAYDEPAAS